MKLVELILRMLVSAEDNLCGQSVRSVVDGHSSHIGQNLTSDEVGLTSIEHCLRTGACRSSMDFSQTAPDGFPLPLLSFSFPQESGLLVETLWGDVKIDTTVARIHLLDGGD